MKAILVALLVILGLSNALTVVGWHNQSQCAKTLNRSLASERANLESSRETVTLLQSQVARLTGTLTNSTAQIDNLVARLRDYESTENERQRTAKVTAPDVPAPTRGGLFQVVTDKNGKPLASSATFQKLYGRKLVFSTASGYVPLDVDAVHPSVLAHLGIDAEKARTDQARLDTAARNKRANDYQLAVAESQRRLDDWERQETARREQARVNAEIAAKQAEQFRADQLVAAERLKAEAAMRQADAAMAAAQNPAPGIVIQNQNNNQRYR